MWRTSLRGCGFDGSATATSPTPTASHHNKTLSRWSDAVERAWGRSSLPLSLYFTYCLSCVSYFVYCCGRWVSGEIAIMAPSAQTLYRLLAGLAAADLMQCDKSKLSVSLLVHLPLLTIFTSADVDRLQLRWFLFILTLLSTGSLNFFIDRLYYFAYITHPSPQNAFTTLLRFAAPNVCTECVYFCLFASIVDIPLP